jgi:hypothetical protein
LPHGPAGKLSALARRLDRDAAGVDNPKVGAGGLGLNQAEPAEQSGKLLALVLIDLAAERLNAESFHRRCFRETNYRAAKASY